MIKSDMRPTFVEPQRARLVAVPPDGPAWVHEVKFDGYRTQAIIAEGRTCLLTRTGLDWTHRYGALPRAFVGLPLRTAIIDGEIIVEDDRGISDFALLSQALGRAAPHGLVFAAFDLLHLDGVSLLGSKLEERKRRLAHILPRDAAGLRFVSHISAEGPATLVAAAQLGLEGIVSKRLDAPYRPGRAEWTKAKIVLRDEFVVCGYVGSPRATHGMAALVLGYWDRGRLAYAGRVETGFSLTAADALRRGLNSVRTQVPTVDIGGDHRPVVWVAPVLVVEIAYAGWTADGLLRHARFKGIRLDKVASAVRRPTSTAS